MLKGADHLFDQLQRDLTFLILENDSKLPRLILFAADFLIHLFKLIHIFPVFLRQYKTPLGRPK